jgi:hypothetical protein
MRRGAALIAWAIAAAGMYAFQFLAERKPDLDAGVYAHAKAGCGDYPGFLSGARLLGRQLHWATSPIGY